MEPGELLLAGRRRRCYLSGAYATKLAHLRATIEAIAPEVLGVQEVGQPEALEDLRAALGGDWHALGSEHPDQPAQRAYLAGPDAARAARNSGGRSRSTAPARACASS